MIDSRCGLHCTGCPWKDSHGCGGCIETMGNPFHGECPVAVCCQEKGFSHCGECDVIPCEKLYAYSYLDPEHGDKPQGARVEVCRRWAAENGKHAWSNVLLTSAGFEDFDGKQKQNIVRCFYEMLGKPAGEAKVLFIPAAAVGDEAKKMAELCCNELVRTGINPGNIFTYCIDGRLSENDAMQYDVIYFREAVSQARKLAFAFGERREVNYSAACCGVVHFTGGNTAHLLTLIKDTGFDAVIKKMVYSNKAFVGVSAGSLIAAPNIGEPYDDKTAGLALINAYLSVHCPPNTAPRNDLPLPHVALSDNQALRVSWNGYEIIEG